MNNPQTAQTPSSMLEQLEMLQSSASSEIQAVFDLDALETLKVNYLGRKGAVSEILRGLKDVSDADRPAVGAKANTVRDALTALLDEKIDGLRHTALGEKLAAERLDVTMAGEYIPLGVRHPLTRVMQDICGIFERMGFTVVEDGSPEVETEYYNFEALNFPPDHPARDMQDTFYTDLAPHVLLRSQTSNAQIRYLERHSKQFDTDQVRIVVPGRVYRNEEVNSRKNVLFHQVEGLVVGYGIHFGHLKTTLNDFIAAFFNCPTETRFRTSYFPFTEPSVEMDVRCILCGGDGCRTCGQRGWLEILGAGMVDPNVLTQVGINPETVTGFAFGMGLERLTMLKYGVDNIRLFYQNDQRFLEQFGRVL